ncbi:MAG: aminodeoxychorismate synthase component I [Blastocatellia bacterium]|nr:aminodeoxychorismate synthase component I [Blastocatellia bacterium]
MRYSSRQLDITIGQLFDSLSLICNVPGFSVLDSCGVGHLGSHLLIIGVDPVENYELEGTAESVLERTEQLIGRFGLAAVLTLSYDFGLKINGITKRPKGFRTSSEPDLFIAAFECLIVHDYDTGVTIISGNESRFDRIECLLLDSATPHPKPITEPGTVTSNFDKQSYIDAVEMIKEFIRSGDTYQTNLTQQLTVEVPIGLTAFEIFKRLRAQHPAPFGAFIERGGSSVVSASPERFFRIADNSVTTSPIKGTIRRGADLDEDQRLRSELMASEKDRAENTMIVDLLRNDLGRICTYGSVKVESLCDVEEHPSLFHLVSTISGELRSNVSFSEIIRAVFPCGSITGAPKIRTMEIIDQIETADRGLSMGSIGIYIPEGFPGLEPAIQLNVAIRTMVIKDKRAVFNVGGGIVIDSDPECEFAESMLKAAALLSAIGCESDQTT